VITDVVQRWEGGRERYRPAGEVINTAEFEVARGTDAEARAFVAEHHYAKTCGPTAHPFMLYRHGELVGVGAFGPPPSMAAHRAIFPTLAITQAVTLGRFVLRHEVAGNGESWFIARCFDMLRTAGVVAVESCADPVRRVALDGAVRHRGHVGTIYQATNGRYIGRTNAATLRMLPDGTCLSNRAQGKLVRGERGSDATARHLEALGADALGDRTGEAALEWLRYWRPRLTTSLRHPGNHRYVWCLDKRRRAEILKAPALAYPKIQIAA
jgi:hypothetical protein